MTVREMQKEFDRKLFLINEDAYITERPDSETVLYMLNRSQYQYVERNFLSSSKLIENIEAIQRRSDILRNLIKRDASTLSGSPIAADTNDGGIEFDLPTDYMFYIMSNSYADGTSDAIDLANGVQVWIPNRVITHDELSKVITTPYNTPLLRKPCVILEDDDKLILYNDDYTNIYRIDIIYLKTLDTLVIESAGAGEVTTCELAVNTHDDVVDIAVELYVIDHKAKLSALNRNNRQRERENDNVRNA